MLNYTWLYRMIWLGGRFGGGKTSLAVAVAAWLIDKSYARYVCSNLQLGIGVLVDELEIEDISKEGGAAIKDTVVLLDEAWLHLGRGTSQKQVRAWLAFLRKRNNFLIMPSVLPLVSDVTQLRVERVFNGYVFGLPFWIYRWHLGDYRKGGDRGWYVFNDPKSVFGLYDTTAIPGETLYVYDTWQAEDEDEATENS